MNRNFKLRSFAFIVFFTFIFPVFPQIEFGSLDLNSDDFLIFSAEQNIPGTISYKSLFLTQLEEQKIRKEPVILTCFPEKIELLNENKILQVRNRYGTAKYSIEDKRLNWSSSALGIPQNYSRANLISASPDGKYFCYVKKTKNTSGNLFVVDCETQEEKILVEKTPFSHKNINAKWSPDGKFLLYEKNGCIYFIAPGELFKKITLPESYRKIGNGTIDNVQWTKSGNIVYISDDIVFLIEENELYTRGLYAALIGSGRIVGRLPSLFNPLKDKFWTNEDGEKFAIVSNKNTLCIYTATENDELGYLKPEGVFPFLEIDRSNYNFKVFWSGNSSPVLWCDSFSFENPKKVSYAYSVKEKMELLFKAENSIEPLVSPDGKKIAYTDSGKFFVYDISSQKTVLTRAGEKIISAAWNGNFSIYAGGEETVKLINFRGDEKLLFLSSACQPYWSNGKILCRSEISKEVFVYEADKNTWKTTLPSSIENFTRLEKNGRFRVFLGSSLNAKFSNSIYVRSLSGKTRTYSVYKETEEYAEPLKKASLAFDALKNSEGLAEVLYVLDDFNVSGTFFLNGEFIRRYPHKTKQIAFSGNECASMFFSCADLLGNNFLVDKDFVQRGLARNEDEFFDATGKELSLYWHAPFYHSNQLMKDAGAEAGYTYVESFDKFKSGIISKPSKENTKVCTDASSLVDSYIENLYDGIVIPVPIGADDDVRRDYLYEKLDLLISAVLENGYEIVPLKDLH